MVRSPYQARAAVLGTALLICPGCRVKNEHVVTRERGWFTLHMVRCASCGLEGSFRDVNDQQALLYYTTPSVAPTAPNAVDDDLREATERMLRQSEATWALASMENPTEADIRAVLETFSTEALQALQAQRFHQS